MDFVFRLIKEEKKIRSLLQTRKSSRRLNEIPIALNSQISLRLYEELLFFLGQRNSEQMKQNRKQIEILIERNEKKKIRDPSILKPRREERLR